MFKSILIPIICLIAFIVHVFVLIPACFITILNLVVNAGIQLSPFSVLFTSGLLFFSIYIIHITSKLYTLEYNEQREDDYES
jgi:hypothetical protein